MLPRASNIRHRTARPRYTSTHSRHTRPALFDRCNGDRRDRRGLGLQHVRPETQARPISPSVRALRIEAAFGSDDDRPPVAGRRRRAHRPRHAAAVGDDHAGTRRDRVEVGDGVDLRDARAGDSASPASRATARSRSTRARRLRVVPPHDARSRAHRCDARRRRARCTRATTSSRPPFVSATASATRRGSPVRRAPVASAASSERAGAARVDVVEPPRARAVGGGDELARRAAGERVGGDGRRRRRSRPRRRALRRTRARPRLRRRRPTRAARRVDSRLERGPDAREEPFVRRGHLLAAQLPRTARAARPARR